MLILYSSEISKAVGSVQNEVSSAI